MPSHVIQVGGWDTMVQPMQAQRKWKGRVGGVSRPGELAISRRTQSHSNSMDFNSLLIGCHVGYRPADAQDPCPLPTHKEHTQHHHEY